MVDPDGDLLPFDEFIARGAEQAKARPGPRILLVGDLTRIIRDTLRDAPRLRDLWVEGEVGQVSISSAGHCYFTLKDERAQIKCVIFRDDRLMMPFEARTGLRLVAQGSIDIFDAQGVYQLYVKTLQPSGFGDLALRFEALKAKLQAESSGKWRTASGEGAKFGLTTADLYRAPGIVNLVRLMSVPDRVERPDL